MRKYCRIGGGGEKASGSDRNTGARGKLGTERTEKIFSSITTDKRQLNAPGRCPNNEQGIPLGWGRYRADMRGTFRSRAMRYCIVAVWVRFGLRAMDKK